MNLFQYQEAAKSTAIYPPSKNMLYPALGLIGECGEVAEKVKKIIRDDNGEITDNRKLAIMKELGDCCWYIANICCDTSLSLGMIYQSRDRAIELSTGQLNLPKLVFLLNSRATSIAQILEIWYYEHDGQQNQSGRFIALSEWISYILICIELIAKQCDFTLREVYTANIEKLLDRKNRGVIKGEGDAR